MRFQASLLALATVSMLAGCNARQHTIGTFSAASPLQEAQKHCRYNGCPIDPAVIQVMIGSLADTNSALNMVALPPVPRVKAAHERIRTKQNRVIFEKGIGLDYECFEYEHLGIMTNGVVVFLTLESGAGSGVFENLLFVKFERIERGTGENPGRLLMRRVACYPLGDRDRRQIQATNDRVTISPSEEKPGAIIYASDLR